MKQFLDYFVVWLLLLTAFCSQAIPQTEPKPQTTPSGGNDVVRITTNLVQVDVTVVDRSGQPVADLRPDDFVVLEDGKPQKITNLSFISAAAVPTATPVPARAAKTKGALVDPPLPPVTLRLDRVRRAIALVVDDLGLSFESSHRVRAALKRFVDEQMQQGDLVAIVRTGAGIGALQQFTADKRMLYAAIERVRYSLNSRNFNAFAPIGEDIRVAPQTNANNGMAGPPRPGASTESRGSQLIDSLIAVNTPGSEAARYRDDIFTVGTLGAINYILRGLRELPGRKSIILFSDGFRMYDQDQGSRRILDSMERLIDLANRASVVIHTVDARGLQTLGPTAADDLAGPFAPGNGNFAAGNGDMLQEQWVQGITSDLQKRGMDFVTTQQGLGFLSQQTGGMFIRNNNDVEGSVGRVLNNEKGYYLVGYRPDASTFNDLGRRTAFHHIQVQVKRPGVTVRTRAGFYGFTTEETRHPFYKTPADQMYAALASPFASGDVRLRMSSVFGYDPERSAFTESVLHIDANDLSFSKQPDGTYKASFGVLTATFGDNGSLIDQAGHGYAVTVEEANLERMYQTGLIYIVTLPIKKPGAYQLRVAVRDSSNAHIGSANQFIEVPDVKKKRLTLSGIILNASRVQTNSQSEANAASASSAAPSSQGGEGDHALINQAIRRFQHRQRMTYGFYIYNAKLDSARRPQLETQMRLFRDGKLVYTGKSRPLDLSGQTDMRQIVARGEILLGTDLPAGEYVLQVVVVDKLADSLSTQWMDFDLLD
jgi:VWFA-related protein